MKKLLLILIFAAICGTAAAQDLIVKRNAEEIAAKVLRVGGAKIEYTLWGKSSGSVYTLSTADVLYIKYSDGRKEVFKIASAKEKRIAALYKDNYPHYQGDFAVGYGLGVGKAAKALDLNRIVVETVHGIRLSPYAFLGAGAGLNYFYAKMPTVNGDGEVTGSDNGAGVISAFANAKGYYPISRNTQIYLSLDLGASIGAWSYMKSMRDLYTAVGPGISFGSSKNRLRCDLGVRYQYMGEDMSAVMFRLGLGF